MLSCGCMFLCCVSLVQLGMAAKFGPNDLHQRNEKKAAPLLKTF